MEALDVSEALRDYVARDVVWHTEPGYEESDFFVTTDDGDRFLVAVMKVSGE